MAEAESTLESQELARKVAEEVHAAIPAAGELAYVGHPDDGWEFQVISPDGTAACYVQIYPAPAESGEYAHEADEPD